MKRSAVAGLLLGLTTMFGILSASDDPVPEFHNLLNFNDLAGWVNVNTAKRRADLHGPSHRSDAQREAIREFRSPHRVDAHRARRELRGICVEQRPS